MEKTWSELQHQFARGGLRRRDFIAGAVALGISSTQIDQALGQTPKRGGHLLVGMPAASTNDSLDPAVYRADFMLFLGPQLYDSLAVIDEHIQPQPSLAEGWEAKPGGQEWVIRLRKGVQFHNGKEMTSTDVVYSLNHHRGKDSRSAVKIFASSMTDVKATDKYEVTITLDGPNVDLPYILTLLQMLVMPDGATNEGVGTGAFKLETFQPGVRAITKRNPNDWRSDRGYVDSVETVAINDPTARVNALLSGAVHVVERISPPAAVALKDNPAVQIYTITSAGHDSFDMMIDAAPYTSVGVRQALKYAIDREAILRTALQGYGRVGNDQPISPLDPFFAADIPQRPYDPEKAKFLLQKAGFSGSVTLTVADAAFVGAPDMAQIYQASAKKAGLDLQVNRVPDDGYYSKVWNTPPNSFVASYWGGRPTPGLMFTHAYAAKSFSNATHWNNPKFEQLMLSARTEFDVAKRKQICHDMQFILHEEGGAVIPIFTNYLDTGVKKVKGYVPFPMWEMSGMRAAEKVWLEE